MSSSDIARSLPSEGGMPARDPFFDNAKFLAILLVVAGHAIERLQDVPVARALYLFVYLFHMPVFIVVTGYLSRDFPLSSGKARKLITKVGVPYLVFETAYSVVHWRLNGGQLHVSPLSPYWIMWFLMALFMWRLSTPVWQQLRWPVAVAVVISLLSGMNDLPDTLQMNRVLGFAPFYVLGLFLRPAHFELLRRPRARVLAVVVLLGGLATAFVADRHMSSEWTYWSKANAHFHVDDLTGTAMRAALLLAEAILAAAFLCLMPRRRTWFTPLGSATLYAYLLHGFVAEVAQAYGWYDARWTHSAPGVAAVAAIGVATATLLCLPPVRAVTRWAVEPRLGWAFTPLRRPERRYPAGRHRSA